MNDPADKNTPPRDNQQQLRDMNEALLLSAVRQHELTEQAQKAEAVLRASEYYYRTLVEHVKDYAIFSTDLQGRAVTWNQGVQRVLGLAEDEFLGKDITTTIFTPEDIARHVPERELETAAKTGTATDDRWMRRKDGTRFFAAGVTTALRDAAGRLGGFTKIMRDQTEKKKLELALNASELRYRRMFEASQDGILMLDSDGKIIAANPFLCDLLGYGADELVGKELWQIGLLGDKSASETAMRELQDKGYIRYEDLPLETKRGQRVEVEVIASAYMQDDRRVIQCNVRDITERHRLEEHAMAQAAALSDLHRRKDEFLAMLSHELRNPLAPIANAVQLLRLQRGSANRIEQQASAIIERQVGQLKHLVDDLLEVSRITTGRIHLRQERVAAGGIVERAMETVRPLIQQRWHELTVSLPPEPLWLYADTARLEQVVVNLLSNAAKYSAQGGHIWLTVQHEGDEAVLRVRDTGIGIAADLLPRIFDLFTQAERSLDRSEGGLGIGLSLVQRLVELHGGTVEVSSVLGQGSEFIVRLPLARDEGRGTTGEAEGPTLPAPRPSPPVPRLRVLVVDDNADTTESLALLLTAAGHEVRTAHDGPTALDAARDYQPDVILLDIGLPGLNGFEVAKQIRQQPNLKNTMLVAMTGYGQETDRQHSQEAGFDLHLVKPATFARIETILASVAKTT